MKRHEVDLLCDLAAEAIRQRDGIGEAVDHLNIMAEVMGDLAPCQVEYALEALSRATSKTEETKPACNLSIEPK